MDFENQLIQFMTDTAETLGRIEAQQTGAKEQAERDLTEVKDDIKAIRANCAICLDKIPLIETNLSNHLTMHNKQMERQLERKKDRKRYFWYPFMVAVGAGVVLILIRFIFNVKVIF